MSCQALQAASAPARRHKPWPPPAPEPLPRSARRSAVITKRRFGMAASRNTSIAEGRQDIIKLHCQHRCHADGRLSPDSFRAGRMRSRQSWASSGLPRCKRKVGEPFVYHEQRTRRQAQVQCRYGTLVVAPWDHSAVLWQSDKSAELIMTWPPTAAPQASRWAIPQAHLPQRRAPTR